MPAAPFSRQAAVSAWFENAGAETLKAVEQQHLLERLRAVPARPWLWLAPCARWRPHAPPNGLGLCLQRAPDGAGWEGDARCRLQLPLPSEAVNAIVLQHPATLGLELVLAECARVLLPGGRLWLSVLNRHSLYRGHWQWRGMRPPTVLRCRTGLQREGLRLQATQHVGPLWNDAAPSTGAALPALRAVCVLEFEKRACGLISPEPLRPIGWRGPLAT